MLAGQSFVWIPSHLKGLEAPHTWVGQDGVFTKQKPKAEEIRWLAQGLACQGEAEVKLSQPEGSKEWHSLRQVTGLLFSLSRSGYSLQDHHSIFSVCVS